MSQKKRKIRRDVYMDDAAIWYALKHGTMPELRIEKRARSDGPRSMPCYMEYIVTDKKYEDINWDTTDRL